MAKLNKKSIKLLGEQIIKEAEMLASGGTKGNSIQIPLSLPNGMWTKVSIEKPYFLSEVRYFDAKGFPKFKTDKVYFDESKHGKFDFSLDVESESEES